MILEADRAQHSRATIEKAIQYVKFVSDNLSDVYAAPEPTFEVFYRPFGVTQVVGREGLNTEGALRYLRSLHARPRPILSISVAVALAPVAISAA